jgi:Regulator of microtubule dynamics protein 1-3
MRSLAVVIVLSATLAGAPAGGAPAATALAAELAAGDAAAARFDLPATLAAYRAARAAAPDSYEAAWKLARSLADAATLAPDPAERERLCLEAETAARDAVRLRPADPAGHDMLAIALGRLALFEGGKRKVELGKEVKAEADRALRLEPNDDVALDVLGVWNREMASLGWLLRDFAELLYGKLPAASLAASIADLTRAVELRPEVITHRVELGISLATARRWSQAQEQFERALALPTGWVTDDHYRAIARRELARVRSHLR